LGVCARLSTSLSLCGHVKLIHIQVHRLITEATSQENLCQMYVGWMPWM
ncbi:unnamed protein product, partial [Laminaria digitata]